VAEQFDQQERQQRRAGRLGLQVGERLAVQRLLGERGAGWTNGVMPRS
jgi:hypothetical protein